MLPRLAAIIYVERMDMKNCALTYLGWLSVLTGLIGVVVPLLPTTCFLITAMWCFAKGSPETANKIATHRITRPLIARIHRRFLPKDLM